MPLSQATRLAQPEDYDHFLAFFAELELVDDPIPDRARWVAEWLPHTFFLERDGAPVGYAVTHALGELGHVFHVVTHPGHRRQGVGRALMDVAASRLRAAGCSRWGLNVRVGNDPAMRLYEQCGLTVTYRATALRFDWARIADLPREAAVARARAVDPTEDAAIESAFALATGRLESLRRRPGWVILGLVASRGGADLPAGVACFDPTFPGASPFRVARPELAAPLLEAMRAQGRPEDTHVRLVIEADDAVTAALEAAGAEVKLVALHMEGLLRSP